MPERPSDAAREGRAAQAAGTWVVIGFEVVIWLRRQVAPQGAVIKAAAASRTS